MHQTRFSSEDIVINCTFTSTNTNMHHIIQTFHLSGKAQLLVKRIPPQRWAGMSKCEYETNSQTVEHCHIFSCIISVLGDHLR